VRSQEAGSAIDWSSLRRIKGNGSLSPTLRAGHSHFDPLLDAGNLGRRDCRQAIILGLFAWLATFGLVLQTFVVKKNLFTHSPNEWLTAIDAVDGSILKVRRLISFNRLRSGL
jgi:hypothetical protein